MGGKKTALLEDGKKEGARAEGSAAGRGEAPWGKEQDQREAKGGQGWRVLHGASLWVAKKATLLEEGSSNGCF